MLPGKAEEHHSFTDLKPTSIIIIFDCCKEGATFMQWFLIWAHSFWLDWAVSSSVSAALWEVLKWQEKCRLAAVLLSACCSHFSAKAARCFGVTVAELHLVFGFPALPRRQVGGEAETWSLGAPLDLRLKGKVCMSLLLYCQPMGWSQLLREGQCPMGVQKTLCQKWWKGSWAT